MFRISNSKYEFIEIISHLSKQNKYGSFFFENYIRTILYQLGVAENYKGFNFSVCAAKLLIEDPFRILSVTKRIYPEVAKRFHTSPSCVERDIRTLSCVIWERNPKLLQQYASQNLNGHLTASQLITVIVTAVSKQI